jgi:hypothetical protein
MRVERLRSALAAEQEAGVAELDLKFYFVICINFISCAGEAKLGKFDRQGYLGIILIKYLQIIISKNDKIFAITTIWKQRRKPTVLSFLSSWLRLSTNFKSARLELTISYLSNLCCKPNFSSNSRSRRTM